MFLFHLEQAWLPGGFVGVDVFFVISGYLIDHPARARTQALQFCDVLPASHRALAATVLSGSGLHAAARLRDAITALSPHVGHLILLTQPPFRPESASRSGLRKGIRTPFYESADKHEARLLANRVVKSTQEQGANVIDVEELFMADDCTVRAFDAQGRELYQDEGHLSEVGAQLVVHKLQPLLERFASRQVVSTAARWRGGKNAC